MFQSSIVITISMSTSAWWTHSRYGKVDMRRAQPCRWGKMLMNKWSKNDYKTFWSNNEILGHRNSLSAHIIDHSLWKLIFVSECDCVAWILTRFLINTFLRSSTLDTRSTLGDTGTVFNLSTLVTSRALSVSLSHTQRLCEEAPNIDLNDSPSHIHFYLFQAKKQGVDTHKYQSSISHALDYDVFKLVATLILTCIKLSTNKIMYSRIWGEFYSHSIQTSNHNKSLPLSAMWNFPSFCLQWNSAKKKTKLLPHKPCTIKWEFHTQHTIPRAMKKIFRVCLCVYLAGVKTTFIVWRCMRRDGVSVVNWLPARRARPAFNATAAVCLNKDNTKNSCGAPASSSSSSATAFPYLYRVACGYIFLCARRATKSVAVVWWRIRFFYHISAYAFLYCV